MSTRWHATVTELKGRLTYAEFVEQIAYHQMAPWGEDWKQAQAISASITSASPKFKRIDLAPFFPKQHQQTADEIFDVAKQLAIDAEARRKAQGGGK